MFGIIVHMPVVFPQFHGGGERILGCMPWPVTVLISIASIGIALSYLSLIRAFWKDDDWLTKISMSITMGAFSVGAVYFAIAVWFIYGPFDRTAVHLV